MKRIIKLTSFAAIVAAFVGAAAYADDPQLQQRLAQQRTQDTKVDQGPTIALYSGRKGLSRKVEIGAPSNYHPKLRFETRYNAQGEAFGVYTTAE